MTEADRQMLREDMRQVVREEMAAQACACKLEIEERREMGHLIGMVRDVGDGDIAKGVEVLRDQVKTTRRILALSSRISTIIIGALATSLVAAALAALWVGVKVHLGGKP